MMLVNSLKPPGIGRNLGQGLPLAKCAREQGVYLALSHVGCHPPDGFYDRLMCHKHPLIPTW